MRFFLLLLLSAFTSLAVNAQTHSNGNGNWNATGPWDTGIVPPDNGDTVFIEVGDVISINTNTVYSTTMVIVVRGTLTLDHTLTLPSGSKIIIQPGGLVNSGNNGWRLDIGSVSWKDFKKDPHTGGVLTDLTLAINSIDFNIESDLNKMKLSWNIKGDNNLKSLILEKSYDGDNFEFETELNNSINGIEEIDNSLYTKAVYFRLKADDSQGSVYSEVKKVENLNKELSVYPNPFNDKLTINNDYSTEMSVQIIDMLGNIVLEEIVNDVVYTDNLESGLYFVHIYQSGNLIMNKRIVKK